MIFALVSISVTDKLLSEIAQCNAMFMTVLASDVKSRRKQEISEMTRYNCAQMYDDSNFLIDSHVSIYM